MYRPIQIFLLLFWVPALCGQTPPADDSSQGGRPWTLHVERDPVANGAELITVFERRTSQGSPSEALDIPIVAVLRDTLGDSDPEKDRLRYVWLLTYTRPALTQRVLSALPFFCLRTGGKTNASGVPSPTLDLAAPGKDVWANLAGDSVQALRFDPEGMMVRSSTRSYRENSGDYRKLEMDQALEALAHLESQAETEDFLSDEDYRVLYSRLSLSNRTLGGLVRPERLDGYYAKEMDQAEETRGHNWELLRQRAESAGLYFDPLALPGLEPNLALVWIARDEVASGQARPFDSKFLGISNPWTDGRLRRWEGYSETRCFDTDNRTAPAESPGAHCVEMIPLSLYSLDHPRVPLLLADFRADYKPKRHEYARHAATDFVTGILGITRFGNWPFLAIESSWTFVSGRRGAAVNRSARLEAYSEARDFLAQDNGLNPKLKSELQKRLDHLALNPLENSVDREAKLARQQYDALQTYARSPNGLARKLDHDRRAELNAYEHSRPRRVLDAAWNTVTRGPHGSREQSSEAMLAALGERRRVEREEQFLEKVLASTPRPEVALDAGQIRQSVAVLSASGTHGPDPRAAQLIAKVFARTEDYDTRLECLRALRQSDAVEARAELKRLYQDSTIDASWRALCLTYLSGDLDSGAGSSAEQ